VAAGVGDHVVALRSAVDVVLGVVDDLVRPDRPSGTLLFFASGGLKRVKAAGEGGARAVGDIPWRGVQELAGLMAAQSQ
jgi:hypothetical protein